MSLFGNYIDESYNKVLIGTFPWPEDEALNEDLISSGNLPGHIDGGNNVKIEIYTNEGENVPHFHIEGKKFSCCVRLYSCGYFPHGTHTDILNNVQARYINKIMQQKYTKIGEKTITNWQQCDIVWNRYPHNLGYDPSATKEENENNMAKYHVKDADEQPDYSNLNR
ncbi:MAG: hypothetical protein IKR19_08865 [Acholeplasmatales bacterium]|nr:hypothetical protein [Acholeplasmatales bacterium]